MVHGYSAPVVYVSRSLMSIETGQLEHGNDTVEEFVEQLLVQERRANLGVMCRWIASCSHW